MLTIFSLFGRPCSPLMHSHRLHPTFNVSTSCHMPHALLTAVLQLRIIFPKDRLLHLVYMENLRHRVLLSLRRPSDDVEPKKLRRSRDRRVKNSIKWLEPSNPKTPCHNQRRAARHPQTMTCLIRECRSVRAAPDQLRQWEMSRRHHQSLRLRT